MYTLKVETDLSLPHTQTNPALAKLIRGCIKDKTHLREGQIASLPWDARQFSLDKVTCFEKLSAKEQGDILKRCNEILLSDFYFLEKSGLAYCAKMILLAENVQIRQLYGLIASDEATHLEWFSPYVAAPLRHKPQGKLLPVLGAIIEDCDAPLLYYLVQTIIEGWGFFIYRELLESCQHEDFKKILKDVVRDEAMHHKAGPALFEESVLSSAQRNFIYDRMVAYAEIIRVGPQMTVQAIEYVTGELSLSALEEIFTQLQTEVISDRKLILLQHLMNQPGMEKELKKLSDSGYSRPYNPAQCAKIYLQTRSLPQYVI